ncbi:MAG: glycosyltransferase family 39 protein [bacterium]|nr:glycosyltransferase family 39 protein [bacterium]
MAAPASRAAAASDRARTPFPWRQAALVLAVALIVRALYWIPASGSLFMQTPVVDASFFDQWARALVEGRLFQAQAFFKPPLAAYVLAALYRLGLDMQGVLVLQLLVGAATTVVSFAIARLAFSPRVALAGALAGAALPILPFFEAQMVAEAWTSALAQGALLLFLLGARPREHRAAAKLAVAGLLLGVAALGRPNLLIVLPVLAAWLVWQARAERKSGPGARSAAAWWRPLLPLAISCAVAIVPTTLHNLRYGEFVPISANLGVNLLTGNADEADGLSAIPVGVRWDGLQLAARQRGAVKPGAFSDLMTRDALAWIAAHPGRALELLGRKVLLLLNAREARNNINPRWLAEHEGVFVLSRWWPGTWLLLPLAVAGLLLVPRSPQARLIAWLVVVQAAAILPFFVAARFRAPLLPLAAPFAAAFVAALWTWRRQDRRRFTVGLGVALGLLIVANVDWLGLAQPRWLAQDRYNLGIIHTRSYGGREPDQAAAAEFFRAALIDDPTDVDVHERYAALLLMQARPDVDRAGALLKAGRRDEGLRTGERAAPLLEEAARHHARALELYPRSHRSAQNLGLCRLWQGELAMLRIAEPPTPADEPAALAALTMYGQSVGALRVAARIDPQWNEPRQALQDVLRRVQAVPGLSPAVESRRTELIAAAGR